MLFHKHRWQLIDQFIIIVTLKKYGSQNKLDGREMFPKKYKLFMSLFYLQLVGLGIFDKIALIIFCLTSVITIRYVVSTY